jgi:prepilin-type N-terminal cleavage/methylation domain-containing protein
MKRHRAGFTLIELLIALGILALLAALGYRALRPLTESEAKLTAEPPIGVSSTRSSRASATRAVRPATVEPVWFRARVDQRRRCVGRRAVALFPGPEFARARKADSASAIACARGSGGALLALSRNR